MSENSPQDQVNAFEERRPLYEAFAAKLESLLKDLMSINDVKVQVVESRAKTIASFKEKIGRAGKQYINPLNEVSDLCGARIIVYYGDEVQKAGDVIKREFDVVEEELSHQPELLEADRFGYLSVHYVVALRADRASLAEWSFAANLRAEVQIRTVIQHAWSAVSHALQYKQEAAIPSLLRRRLFRIAGLFELADEEFIGIREQKAELQKLAAEAIAEGNRDIPLSSASIREVIGAWPQLDEAISKALEAGFLESTTDPNEMIPDIYDLAAKAGLKTIDDLVSAIDPPSFEVFKAVEKGRWVAHPDFLFFILLLRRFPDVLDFDDFIRNGWDEEMAKELIKDVLGRNL